MGTFNKYDESSNALELKRYFYAPFIKLAVIIPVEILPDL
jgi:hypothetical protein